MRQMPRWQGSPMGDCQNEDLRVQCDRGWKLKFLASHLTTDAGLLGHARTRSGVCAEGNGSRRVREQSNRQQQTTKARAACAAVDLQPTGRLRRRQRCRAAIGIAGGTRRSGAFTSTPTCSITGSVVTRPWGISAPSRHKLARPVSIIDRASQGGE